MATSKSIPFEVTPGEPTLLRVKDNDSKIWEIKLNVVATAVRSLGTKDPITGHSVFEFDVQVITQTSPKEA